MKVKVVNTDPLNFWRNKPTCTGYFIRKKIIRQPRANDDSLLAKTIGDIKTRQLLNGSWNNSIYDTACEMIKLFKLGGSPKEKDISNAVTYLFTRQDLEGAYAKGCTDKRHSLKICEHFIGGFFSPGPWRNEILLEMPNGQKMQNNTESRFVISNLVLKAIVMAGITEDPRLRKNIVSLRTLPYMWSRYNKLWSVPLLLSSMQALTVEDSEESQFTVHRGLKVLEENQMESGLWRNVNFYYVLDTLNLIDDPLAEIMIENAIPEIQKRQLPDGTWGSGRKDEQSTVILTSLKKIGEI